MTTGGRTPSPTRITALRHHWCAYPKIGVLIGADRQEAADLWASDYTIGHWPPTPATCAWRWAVYGTAELTPPNDITLRGGPTGWVEALQQAQTALHQLKTHLPPTPTGAATSSAANR